MAGTTVYETDVPGVGRKFVLAALAVTAGGSATLTTTIPALAVGYVLVMSVLGTLLMRYSGPLERFAERRVAPSDDVAA